MSTSKKALDSRFAAAASARLEPGNAPGQTAIRTKPVRITIDLDPAAYTALNHWIEHQAQRIGPTVPFRRLSQSAAVRAMIDAAVKDETVTLVVLNLPRRDLEQA